MKRVFGLLCSALLAALVLAGCASTPVQAPVLDRAPAQASKQAAAARAEAESGYYTVKRGDTMFSIALDHGLDYRELAAWNNVQDPNRIRPGQKLRIKPPPQVAQESAVTVHPVTSSGRVETRQLGAPVGVAGPAAEQAAAGTAPGAPVTPGAGEAPTQGGIKSGPLARKLPYSPENVALLQSYEAQPRPAPAPASTPAPTAPNIVTPAAAAIAPAAAPAAPPAASATTPAPETAAKTDSAADDKDKVDWGWPAHGKIIAGFSDATNKGIDIAGVPGDPVVASAPGRVVYSGSGLRGYGKLVIIKHNKTYLSAYAHNSKILVKEGQTVVKGQKIAEIGSTDSDRPMLHFEIRKLGKPVDPAKYLPPS